MMTSALDADGPMAKIETRFASLSQALRRFLDWERREAEKLTPQAVRAWALGRGARAAVLSADRGELTVAEAPGSPGFCISAAELLSSSLREALARRNLSPKALVLTLELPPKSFLTRRFDLPAAALSRLEAIVTGEIERKTPFRREDLFVQAAVRAHPDRGKATAVLTLLRRDLAARALEGSGLALDDFVEIRSDNGGEPLRIALRKPSDDRGFLRAAGALAGLAAVLIVVGLGLAFWRQGQQAADLDDAIAELAAQSAKIRESAERAGKEASLMRQLHDARRTNAPLTTLWEEISRLTPDNAYLSQLRVTQASDGERSVELVGLARSAVDLPLLYRRSRYVSEATLTAPITVDPRENMENFSLRLKIRPAPAEAEGLK